MREILKAIGLGALASGLLWIGLGGHRLQFMLRGHRYTVAQYTLFGTMALVGVLGCLGGALLLRLRPSGVRYTLVYLALLSVYLLLADLGALHGAALVLVVAAAALLFTKSARQACRVPAGRPETIG